MSPPDSKTEAEVVPEPGAKRPLWRRGLRWLGWIVGGSILLVFVVVLSVLYSSVVGRWVVARGVAMYADSIPGDVSIGTIEGRLAGDLVLHDVRLEDHLGRPLVTADRLRLGLDVAAALGGRLDVGALELEGARVFIPDDGRGGFADLAPVSEAAPEPTPGIGPDLPLRIDAALTAASFELWTGPTLEEATQLARVDELELDAWGEGRRAGASLSVRGSLPTADLQVEALELHAAWDEPTVVITQLRAKSNWAAAELERAALDVEAMAGALQGVRVELDETWTEATLGVDPGAPWTIALDGRGSPDDLEVSVAVDAATFGNARLLASGRPTNPIDARLRIDATLGRSVLGPAPEVDTLHVTVSGHARGDPQQELAAQLGIVCHDCDPRSVPVSVVVDATGAPSTPSGRLQGAVFIATTALGVEAELRPEGRWSARADVAALELQRVAEVLSRFIEPPELAGRVGTRLSCEGLLDPWSANCDVAAAVRQGKPVTRADLVARVALGDDVRVQLDTLELAASGVDVSLASGPARLTVAEQSVDVRNLDVRVATATGRGRVTADGVAGGSGPQTAAVGIHGLQLAAANAFVPGLGLGGRLDGQVRLEGTAEEPRIEARLTGRRLSMRGHALGDLRVAGGYAQGEGRASLRARGGPLQRVDLDARVPVDLDLLGTAKLRAGQPARATLKIRGLNLDEATALAPTPIPLTGTAGVDATLSGSLSRPRIELSLDADGLAYEGRPLGDLDLDVSHAPARTEATVVMHHPSVRELRAQASTRVGLDLAASRFDWSPRRPLRATLSIDRADLSELLKVWAPEVPLSGIASARIALDGDLVDPNLDVELGLRSGGYAAQRIGSFDLGASYRADEQRVELAMSGKGPALEGLGLTASVPVELAPGLGVATWRPEQPHDIEVALVGVVLHEVARWVPEPIALTGRGDLQASLHGPVTAPILHTDLTLERVRYGGRAVGDVELGAGYADDVLDVQARVQHDVARHMTASVHAPLRLDLIAATVQPRVGQEHRLVVDAPRIDKVLLDPFVELPEDLDLDLALNVNGKGSIADARVNVSLGGEVAWSDIRQPLTSTAILGVTEQRLDLRLGSKSEPMLEVQAGTKVAVEPLVRGRGDLTTAPLTVAVRGDALDLRMAAGLVPTVIVNPSGKLRIQADVGGTIGTPRIDGALQIHGGALTIVPARQRLEDIELRIVASNERIELRRLTAHSGRGTLQGSGAATFGNGRVQGAVQVRARKLPLRSPGLPHLQLTTTVDTELRVRPDGRTITVAVADTQVGVSTTQTTAPKPIPSDDEVHYVQLVGEGAIDPGPAAARAPEAQPDSDQAPVVPTVIAVNLVDPVRIIGPAVDMPWQGSIRTSIGPTGTTTEGAVLSKQGYFDLLGNQFRISEGKVTIPEGQDATPFIDLIAESRVGDVDVTAHVRGRVTRPELTFTSEPSMTQSQIFTLLVTGAADGQGAEEGEVEAKAASMLAAFSNPALQRQLNERLRVDRIGVGFGDSAEQPILSVGKHVTKKVYVETQYHHNAPRTQNRAQLEVRYRFAPRWSLETFFGDAAAGGVDLFWGRSFDVGDEQTDEP